MSKKLFLIFVLSIFISACILENTNSEDNSTTVFDFKSAKTAETTKNPETSWIFIPVDDAGIATDGQYYLPLDMFRKMYQSPTARQAKENRYFFRSAIYTGTISSSLTSRDLLVDAIRATYEVDVQLPETKIRFPFRSSEVYLSPGATLLNGEPVQTFSEDGELVVHIARPGRYALEFALIPIVASQETESNASFRSVSSGGTNENAESGSSEALSFMNGFRFEIPVIPNSRLELYAPTSQNSLQFPTALGAQHFDQTVRKWKVQLGNAAALAVQWKAPFLRGSGNGEIMAEELYSWELGNKNRMLHCRYQFRAREGSCSRLEWSLDPSLNFEPENVEVFLWKEYAASPYHEILLTNQPLRQLVPYAGKKEITSRIDGNKRYVTLTLAEAVQEPILACFSLTSTGTGNAGSFVLPSIRTEKTRITRRWFQISGESNCQLSLTNLKNGITGGVPTVTIQEFATAWEEFTPATSPAFPSASTIPVFALDDTDDTSQSQLYVVHSQPLPAISTVKETLAYAFDKDAVYVNYTIQFPSTESIPALFHLQIPENLNVEKILLHDTQRKNLRYSRNSLTEIAVFYDRYGDSTKTESMDENKTTCKIEITGTIELAEPQSGGELRVPFPKTMILGDSLHSTSRVIRLYRTPRVLVTNHLENSAGELLTSITLPEGEPISMFENIRWVATFSAEPQEEIHGFLIITPNQPEIGVYCRTFLKMPHKTEKKAETKNVLEVENTENLKSSENIAQNTLKAETKKIVENGDELKSASSRWKMTMEMLLTVENGLADEITLEIPSDLTTGFTLEPPMEYSLETISNLENAKDGTKTETNLTQTENTAKNKEETPLKKYTQEPLGVEWSRMTIRPKTPFSGTVALRLNTELQDNRLDSSTRTSLVRLPIVRFPGVTVKSHDVILPVLPTEKMKTRYRWAIEGMLPVQASRFELLRNEPMALNSEEYSSKNPPILPEWRTGKEVRICHIFDKRYTAQLLARSRNTTNPTVEAAIYSAYWNPKQELLGVGVFDVYPQKSPTCVLRIPREMEILEMHLDSRPIQVEEVRWSQDDGEFLPIDNKMETGNQYRFYRITLRSLQLPQRLETLFHCTIPNWRVNPRFALSSPFRALDRLYHLEFPVLVRQLGGAHAPITAKNGAVFFYTGMNMPINFWTKTKNARSDAGNVGKTATTMKNQTEEKVERETTASNSEKSPNRIKTGVETTKNNVTESHGRVNSYNFNAVTTRPWHRVQLACMERFLAMTTQVSAFQPTGQASRDELRHWFETWNLLRFGNERLVQLSLNSETGLKLKNRTELVQNFERLKLEGTRIFTRMLGESNPRPEVVRVKIEQLYQNSLWLVFLRNISHDGADCQIAFETGGAYDFYITEPHSDRFYKIPYLWQSVLTLFFTLLFALGVYFRPTLPEEVRTLPFWLLCTGILCILCGVNFWLSASFLVVAILSLIYRLGILARD